MTGISAGFGPIRYLDCSITGYLEGPYLSAPYLGANTGYCSLPYMSNPYMFFDLRCGNLGLEALQVIDAEVNTGLESLQTIDAEKNTSIETLQTIDAEKNTGIEIIRFRADPTGLQCFFALYNVNLLRVLCEFDSRGVVINNWVVQAGGTAAGHFDINNINTDIWEEIYRSNDVQITIDCDIGIARKSRPDTFWWGNHNLTSGANITVIGSNDPTFVAPEWQFIVETITPEQVFYILPEDDFPLTGVRYVRQIIVDTTNPAGYLEFGHILFSSAIVFNGDCITQDITKQIVQFKDEFQTEGFTSSMNHRALRKNVNFQFKNLRTGLGNYNRLVDDVFLKARTDLKCLWIPYPLQPTRFGVFAKLTTIPAEQHNLLGDASQDLDFVSFDISVDEAL